MNRPAASGSDNMTINQKYANFVDYVNKASNEIFTHDNSDKKRNEWVTNEIMEIVDKKAKAFLQWQNHRGTNLERQHRSRYNLLRTKVKKMVEARQVEYWDEISEEIETAIKHMIPQQRSQRSDESDVDEPILKIFPFKASKASFY